MASGLLLVILLLVHGISARPVAHDSTGKLIAQTNGETVRPQLPSHLLACRFVRSRS